MSVPNKQTPSRKSGFSIAELLISVMILGEIATFTIPKILIAQQNQRKIAVFKESLATISVAVYNTCQFPDTYSGMSIYNAVSSQINTVKLCPNNALTEGCSPTSSLGDNTEGGFVLHNGASLGGLQGTTNTTDNSLLDWNGLDGPNIAGDDQIRLSINYGSASLYNGVRRCTIGPDMFVATSVSLYNTIYP